MEWNNGDDQGPAELGKVEQSADGVTELLFQHQDWLRRYVSRKLPPHLRRLESSGDLVQEVFQRLLYDRPSLSDKDTHQFRRLAGTIAVNRVRDLHRRSDVNRHHTKVPSDTSPHGEHDGGTGPSDPSPSQAAVRLEDEAFIERALDEADGMDAQVIRLRYWKGLSFKEMGDRLGVDEATAKMRLYRARVRVGAIVKRLKGPTTDS